MADIYDDEFSTKIDEHLQQMLKSNTNYGSSTLELTESERLLQRYISSMGGGGHHVLVYDAMLKHRIAEILMSRTLEMPNGNIICFKNIEILPPRYTHKGKPYQLTPQLAREQGATYGCDIHVDAYLTESGCNSKVLDIEQSICIGNIPLMLKSQNCVLHGKSREELQLYGEDPDDPAGYFIVQGKEKLVLLQEMLSTNKIYIMIMNHMPVIRMTANTPRGTAVIELSLDQESRSVIEIKLPSMRVARQEERQKSINALKIFRLLGIDDVNDIIGHIRKFIKPENRKKSLDKLTRSIVDFMAIGDDVEFIAREIDKKNLEREAKEAEVKRILDTDLFPHVNSLAGPDGETEEEREARITAAKINLLSIMIARLLEYMAGLRKVDNRDSWSNKRVEGAGRLMEQLFRNAWRETRDNIQANIKNLSFKRVAERLKSSIITDTFVSSFNGVGWGVKGNNLKQNISQALSRDGIISTYSQIQTVDVKISRNVQNAGLRRVQDTQYGYICPVSTPEGENCGLLKNLAITAHITVEQKDSDIIRRLIGDAERNMPSLVVAEEEEDAHDKLLVNGKFLGWCNGAEVQQFLIQQRRMKALPSEMSVIMEDDFLYVDISPSRLIRPLLIVDENQQLVIDREGLRDASINDLLSNGAMEYISAWEQEYIKLAPTPKYITDRLNMIRAAEEEYDRAVLAVDMAQTEEEKKQAAGVLASATMVRDKARKSQPYTHCELCEQSILSVAAAMIPWPNHNQAPRNTYQVSMGKQAIGEYHSNHRNRMRDGKCKILAYHQRPLVETAMYNMLGLDRRGPGQMCKIAFMAFPNTEEDAFVVSREYLERGGHRYTKYLTYTTTFTHSGDTTDKFACPELRQGDPQNRYRYIQNSSNKKAEGLPFIGAPIKRGECVIGKHQFSGGEMKNESVILRVGDEGVVEKVLVVSDFKTSTVIVKLAVPRQPQAGDKFAPRNAQKGTIGLVLDEKDMPFDEYGVTPDFIMNPHCLPSRMTLSYPLELLASKYAAMAGEHVNGGPFVPPDLNTWTSKLDEYGMDRFGYENMRSGLSGKRLESKINVGPCYIQALKHHVLDKYQSRSTGPVKALTHQPAKGRGNNGGLRFGEMERDAAVSHGGSSFLRSLLMLVSDGYQTAFCKNCGIFAVYDAIKFNYRPCRLCGNSTFGKATIPYAYKLLIHLLGAMGLNLHPVFKTADEFAASLFNRSFNPSENAEDTMKDNILEEFEDEIEPEDESAYMEPDQ